VGSESEVRRPYGVPMVLACAAVASLGALVLALLLAGGGPEPAPAGLPDAGLVPEWGLRIFRLLLDLTAVLTIGCLVTGGVLLPSEPGGALGSVARSAVGRAAGWAVAWAVTAAVSFVLTASDLTGAPPSELTTASLRTVAGTSEGRALLIAALLAAVVAVAARQVRSVVGAVLLVGVALAGLLPVGAAGHASTASDHDVAVSGLVVHVGAAALWVGGLAGVFVLARRSPADLAGAARRFSALALVAFLTLGGSGLLIAVTRLSTSVSAWTSGYGALVLAKAAALVTLGCLGLAHRRRTLPALTDGRAGGFVQLAAGELVLMAAVTGIAAALSRTPVPPLPVSAEPAHGGGHSTLPSQIDPISLGELLTAWRLNAVLLLVLGLALAAYLAGVRTLVRRREPWPRSRTAAFTGGIALGLVATCSGVATYAPAMVSVQIAQLLLMLVPVPALLVLGAPVTLWLRAQGAGGVGSDAVSRALPDLPVLRVLSDPFAGAMGACVVLVGLYRSSLIEVSLSSSWVHLLVLLAAMTVGLVLLWPVLGVDPAPGARSRLETAGCVAAVVGCLGLLAVQLRAGYQLLAGTWFLELRWSWVDPVSDQRLGGALAGVAAAALALLAAVPLLRRPNGRAVTASADSAPARPDGPRARA
jgi:cytochrome c oxidase assembly factor CtaG/putative copper export protein